eukprot:3273008-Rhodomonas_salina.1
MGLTTYTGSIRVGVTGCESTEWESETAMRCLMAGSVRGTRRVMMTAGERVGSVTSGWSTDTASL